VSRAERRAATAYTRKQATTWPEHLVPIPESDWPSRPHTATARPVALWRSRNYLVTQWACPDFQGIVARRLSINRTTMGVNGHWDQDIPWEHLQRCKRETGHGAWYAVEIYPRDCDIVNVANMRHLWLLAEPLSIGWFNTEEP
jgi:hypothetical protein